MLKKTLSETLTLMSTMAKERFYDKDSETKGAWLLLLTMVFRRIAPTHRMLTNGIR